MYRFRSNRSNKKYIFKIKIKIELLIKDPNKRYNLEETLDHSWLKSLPKALYPNEDIEINQSDVENAISQLDNHIPLKCSKKEYEEKRNIIRNKFVSVFFNLIFRFIKILF